MIKEDYVFADAPFAIVTNVSTGKWFRAKKCRKVMTSHKDFFTDITFIITPENINDIIPVLGAQHLGNCLLKKELVGDNKKLHIEIFNADNVKQYEYFLYEAWISSIDCVTNEIVLGCNHAM
jgi:hypothetical protein